MTDKYRANVRGGRTGQRDREWNAAERDNVEECGADVSRRAFGMTSQTQQFRVRYFGRSNTVLEVETAARDTAEAIREAREAQWPPKAVSDSA